MTNNCLVKKYKTAVQDSSLLRVDEILVPVMNGTFEGITSSSGTMSITGMNGVKIKGQDSVEFTGTLSNAVISGIASGKVGYIKVSNKYNLTELRGPLNFNDGIDDEFEYTAVTLLAFNGYSDTLSAKSVKVDVNDISDKFKSLSFIAIDIANSGAELTGNIINFANVVKDNLIAFNIDKACVNELPNTFEDFGHLYKIGNFYSTVLRMQLSGTIEGFVANRLIEQPATAGSVSASWLGDGGRITYNGQAITNKANNTIAWDAQGNITLS